MSIANDIIDGKMPDFTAYLQAENSLDDTDEYGFTPLIECAIMKNSLIAEELIKRGVTLDKPDVTGRTALHWAVDNNDINLIELFLKHGANPNAYTRAGLSVLVYPLLRKQTAIKKLLYQYGAKLDFAMDFILGKLLGHRYELVGDVEIVNDKNEFIELDFEGFILEFTVAVIKDSLHRFIHNYSARHLRTFFPYLQIITEALGVASSLLKFQYCHTLTPENLKKLEILLQSPLLILPAASSGHAMGFVKYQQWWAKIDRGENSQREGSVIIYKMSYPHAFNVNFLQNFLYKRQPTHYFHKTINQQLGLTPLATLPIKPQTSGNCSWANIQATISVAYALQQLAIQDDLKIEESLWLYNTLVEWDKDRALNECIQRFYSANRLRRASIAAMLGAALFQGCDYAKSKDLERAEKIFAILTLPEYYYILENYLEVYCIRRLTYKGNNLLKMMDDCGINPNINVRPVATGMKDK